MADTLREYVLYLRKSKGRAGISRQRAITTTYLQKNNGTVVAEYVDVDRTAFRKIGAGRPERPDFDRMLAELPARPGVGIAAWHADRLLRDIEESEILIRAAVAGGHVVETPSGGTYNLATANGRRQLRRDVVDAQGEVDHMIERMTAQKAEAAANGEWHGGGCRPFGWEKDGVTLIPAEAALIKSGSDAILTGQSLSGIAREWNASGVLTPSGLFWSARAVGQVLRRPRNAGLMEHQGKILEGVRACWPPAVTDKTWRGVMGALSAPGRRTSPSSERRWLLSGLATCGVCGRGLVSTRAKGKGHPQYRCRSDKARCLPGHLTRDSASLDAYVTEVVLERLRRADATDAMKPAADADVAAALHVQIHAARQQLDEAAGLYAAREIDARQLATITRELNGEMEKATRELAALSRSNALAAFAERDPEDVWEMLDLDRKRAVIRLLMTVTVHPAPRGRPAGWRPGESYFDPDYVDIGPPKG